MWQDLMVAFIGMSWQKHAATFRGWRDFEVQQEMQYLTTVLYLYTLIGLPWMGSGDQVQYIFALFTIPAHTNPLNLSLKISTDCQKNSVFGGA